MAVSDYSQDPIKFPFIVGAFQHLSLIEQDVHTEEGV